MAISVHCPHCGDSFRVKDEFAGKRGKCPKCEKPIEVPAAVAAAEIKPAASKPAAGATSPASLLDAFQGEIEPVPQTLAYTIALLLVGAVMVVLPIIYVALICLVGYGVYLHLVNDTWLFTSVRAGRATAFAFIFYIGLAFAGGLAILFMIKPLFARPATIDRRRSLTRNGEPLLFAFVDRICDTVGAVRPKRIDVDCQVNASASFRRGIWSMIVGDDLVLTIGMPLVTGLSAQQFASVLAHEFGHFSQGLGMRMTYLIRSISFWFTRVVYERDVWDQWLSQWCEGSDSRIGIILGLTRLMIWCTRGVLWVLMMIGHLVGGYLLRQMEFDADRYETRMGGSASFEQTTRRLAQLSIAYQGAMADLGEFYREGRLGDDLPKLTIHNLRQFTPEVHKKIDKLIGESKTGWFDTHPSDKDRILSSRRENAPGVFHAKQPASALFNHYDAICKNVSLDFYREVFGDNFNPTTLHPVDNLTERQTREQEEQKATARFYQGAFTTLRVPALPTEIADEDIDAKATAAELVKARKEMLALTGSAKEVLKLYDECDTHVSEAAQARVLLKSNLRLRPGTFKLRMTNQPEIEKAAETATRKQIDLRKQLAAYESAAGRRLTAALTLLSAPQVARRLKDVEVRKSEVDTLLPILDLYYRTLDEILIFRNTFGALSSLVGNLEGNQQNEQLLSAIRNQMEAAALQMRTLSERFSAFRYPLDHAKSGISIAQYALENVPRPDNLGEIFESGGRMLENLFSLYVRLLSRLVETAEVVETAVGLPRLPDPEPEPESEPNELEL